MVEQTEPLYMDPDKPFDPADLVMPTPEYTGPDEGDYEQEGR